MSTFNHIFSISFEVPNSVQEDGTDCIQKEKTAVIASLLERVDMLLHDDSEYQKAMEWHLSYGSESQYRTVD